MANATKVNATKEKVETRTETVVKDAAEGLGVATIADFLWKYLWPRALEVGLHIKDRVKAEYTINRGRVGSDIAMLGDAQQKKLLERLKKAIKDKRNDHFISLLSKFAPDEKGSHKAVFEKLANMGDEDFEAMLTSQDSRVAQFVHLMRQDGRQMIKDDFGFIVDALKSATNRLGVITQDVDTSAGRLAPRVHAFAELLRNRRLGRSGTTTRFTNPTAAGSTGQRQKGDWI